MFLHLLDKNLRYKSLLLLVPILVGILLEQTDNTYMLAVLLAFGGLWIWHINRRTFFFTQPLIYSLLFFSLMTAAAYWLSHRHDFENKQNLYTKYITPKSSYVLQVLEGPKQTPKTQKYLAEVLQVNEEEIHQTIGKVYLYLSKEREPLASGDLMLTAARHSLIESPKNEHEFDFKSFANRKGIFGNIYLGDEFIVKLGQVPSTYLQRLKLKLKNHIYSSGQRYISPEAFPLFVALTLGDKSDMDLNTKTDFAKSGVLHLIALSGFHVIIVWAFILTPLLWIRHQTTRELLAIIILWLYAYMMGAAPSIVRAVAVITLWKGANMIGRRRESMNIIFFIAAVLLLIRPSWIADVGFQLSFLATSSIIYFYQPIYQRLKSSNKILNYFISLMAVSLSAQVFSLPISVYYFHQFPATFLISNILGSAIVMLLVPLNFVLLILSSFEGMATYLGQGITALTEFFYSAVHQFSLWQPSAMSSLYIDYWGLILLYGFVLALVLWLYQHSRLRYVTALVLLLAFGAYVLSLKNMSLKKRMLTIQHLSKASSLMTQYDGKVSHILSREISDFDYQQRVRTLMLAEYISADKLKSDTLHPDQNQVLNIGGKRILVCRSYPATDELQSVDIVLLSNARKIELKKVSEKIKAPLIIADGSNPYYQIEKWKKEAQELALNLHCTSSEGAYKLEL